MAFIVYKMDDTEFMETLHKFFQPELKPEDTRKLLPVYSQPISEKVSLTQIDREKTLSLDLYAELPAELREQLLAK